MWDSNYVTQQQQIYMHNSYNWITLIYTFREKSISNGLQFHMEL